MKDLLSIPDEPTQVYRKSNLEGEGREGEGRGGGWGGGWGGERGGEGGGAGDGAGRGEGRGGEQVVSN